MMRNVVLFAIIFVHVIACNSRSGKRTADTKKETLYTVTKVVDGDTFWIENSIGEGEKIRLIGVDAPESRKTGRKEVGYFGVEAKKYLTSLIGGKRVRLDFDVGRNDRYGRTLAYVYLEDGLFINEHLIKEGYAMIMTVPPNVKFADRFVMLQTEARISQKGLWAKDSVN